MIEFKSIRAGYEGVEILRGISAKLKPGRLTAIIGPNGCGKSTLMKCAAGLIKPSDGEILLNGMDLRTIPEKTRARHLAYMPQSRIVPDISVAQLVAHGRYPHLKWGQSLNARDRDIIAEAIDRVNLAKYARQSLLRLSGGERQRAYIAMMLAQETDSMLLDEPTTHLDLSARFALMDLLKHLSDEGRCVAVVLHDLSLALEYADEILLMRRGEGVASGTPEDVYHSGEIQKTFAIDIRKTADGKYVFYSANQGEQP